MDKRGLLSAEEGRPEPTYGTREEQPEPARGCRDPWFAVLFVLQVAVVAYVAGDYGRTALSRQDSPAPSPDEEPESPRNGHLLILAGALAASAVVLSASWMTFMISKAADIIKCMLWTSVIVNLGVAVLGLAVGEFILSILGFLMAMVSWCYMRAVAPFIPFAAAQLRAATTAIKEFFGVMWLAYAALVVAFAWSVLWSLATYGVMVYYQDHPEKTGSGAEGDDGGLQGLWYFLMLVSFYWTLQVIGGVVNTTVAGVVGSWWFLQRSEHKSVVSGSVWRSVSTSFGSIAFGSLIVAVLEALKAMVEQARKQRDSAARACADCLIGCLDSIAQYFNRWAFTYVGIYGYSFVESSSKVWRLFQRRGLTALINDQLLSRVLFLGSLMVGLVTSGLGVLLGYLLQDTYLKGYGDDPTMLLAVVGFLVGLFVCDVMMNVVSSAVAAVLVSWLEDSAALQYTHPDFHALLLSAWQARFPDVLDW